MNYHNIFKCDMVNGPGLRASIFVSGCPNHCPGCFNQETWDPDSGVPFDNDAYKELMTAVSQPYIEGVTFLGGEPLAPYNIDTVTDLAKDIRKEFPEKTIWCYTGYTFEKVKESEIMNYIDVLVEGPFIEDEKDSKIRWRGSRNQRIIRVQESLLMGDIVLHEDMF